MRRLFLLRMCPEAYVIFRKGFQLGESKLFIRIVNHLEESDERLKK